MRIRNVLLGVAALAIPLGALSVALAPSVAGATTLKTGKGTYNCSSITGTIKFKPALTLSGGSGTETVTISTASSGCSGGKPKVTTSTGSATVTTDSTNCSSLETGLPTITFNTTYPGAAPSTYTASSSSSTSGSGVITFTTSGTVTGSYPSTGANSSATIKQNESAIIASCGSTKGLKKLTIEDGTSSDF
jgi:hypothetical protein